MKQLLMALFLFTSLGQAQVAYTTDKNATYQFDNKSNGMVLRASSGSKDKIEGSEFLKEEWEQATVFDSSAKKKFTLLARFNAYTKEIEIIKEKDIIVLSAIEGISVRLNDKIFVPLQLKNSSKNIFAEQLVKGNIGLFKVYDAKIIKAPSDAALLGVDNKDRIQITDNLYYKKADTTMELPSKKKLFGSILSNTTLEYAKKEKLSFKNELDLIQLFTKENEL